MEPLSPEAAEAIHKAKNAAQAVEFAREVQLQKAVEETAQKTKEALLEGLREVFGESDSENPQQMKVLVRRIPILCTNVEQMHEDLKEMKDNQKWATRIVIGGVIAGVLAMLFK